MSAKGSRLADAGFMRLSRSDMVNLGRIRKLQPLAAGAKCILLQSGTRVDRTRSLRELQARLGGT